MGIGTVLFMKTKGFSNVYTTAGLWGGAAIIFASTFTLTASYKGQENTTVRGLSIAFNIVAVVIIAFCDLKLSYYYRYYVVTPGSVCFETKAFLLF